MKWIKLGNHIFDACICTLISLEAKMDGYIIVASLSNDICVTGHYGTLLEATDVFNSIFEMLNKKE